MNKKPGFQVKIGGETILFIVIGLCIVLFMFFMPNIYKLISDLKTGNLFNSDNTPLVDNTTQNNQEEENEEPSRERTLVCTYTTSQAGGNLIDTYTFYYNNNRLETVKNEKNYDAITDEYLNYVYSEQAKFNSINDLYKEVTGFSYNSTFDSRTLIATFVYDLTKLNPDDLSNDDENLNIELNVTTNQSLESVQQIYNDLGYDCR